MLVMRVPWAKRVTAKNLFGASGGSNCTWAEFPCTRIEVYKHAGYFEPHQAESVKEMARRGRVFEPPRILQRFVQRYGRA